MASSPTNESSLANGGGGGVGSGAASAEGSLGESSLGNHTTSSGGSGITSPGPLGGGAITVGSGGTAQSPSPPRMALMYGSGASNSGILASLGGYLRGFSDPGTGAQITSTPARHQTTHDATQLLPALDAAALACTVCSQPFVEPKVLFL